MTNTAIYNNFNLLSMNFKFDFILFNCLHKTSIIFAKFYDYEIT